jgi:hypothetical protein
VTAEGFGRASMPAALEALGQFLDRRGIGG